VRELVRVEEARIRAAYARRIDDSKYSLFEAGTLFIVQQRERHILDFLLRYAFAELASKTILEVGCGTGYWLREFTKWGARPDRITGIDLLADRLTLAKRSCSPEVRLQCASGTDLPFRRESFDLVFQSTVFTSILDDQMRRRVAAEMLRVVKPHGLILWYDFYLNNPRNGDVRGVKRREIEKLFPYCRIDLRRLTLAPPLARVLARYSYLACYILEKVPLLCTHYLGVIRKES
jgi:ubiquinone/menaquinone biosynthesis C-methylase UbiE